MTQGDYCSGGEVEWRMDGQLMEVASTQRAQKRHADDNLENEQRLAKRLNALKLNNHDTAAARSAKERPRRAEGGDSMQLDDTKDKIYIYNLDDELSDVESEEEKLIFLPDIEKRLTKIPKSVLASSDRPATSSEMILYNVPQSLSIPQEQDNVRKAIIETRARARERQARDAEASQVPWRTDPTHGSTLDSLGNHMLPHTLIGGDEDAMDVG